MAGFGNSSYTTSQPAPYTSLSAIQPATAGPSNQQQTASNSASARISSMSNATYVMSGSPVKNSRRRTGEPYMPKIITTVGT